jgi:hypothetical protein
MSWGLGSSQQPPHAPHKKPLSGAGEFRVALFDSCQPDVQILILEMGSTGAVGERSSLIPNFSKEALRWTQFHAVAF